MAMIPAEIDFSNIAAQRPNILTGVQNLNSNYLQSVGESNLYDYFENSLNSDYIHELESEIEKYKKTLKKEEKEEKEVSILEYDGPHEELKKVSKLYNELETYKPKNLIEKINILEKEIKNTKEELEDHDFFTSLYIHKVKKHSIEANLITLLKAERTEIIQKLSDMENDIVCKQQILVKISLLNKINKVNNIHTCSICIESPIEVVFKCGHNCCTNCLKSIKKCHICRGTLDTTIRIYS